MSVYRGGIVLFGVVFIVLGGAMIVVTASQGFGVGLVLGPLFLLLGVARIYLVLRRSR